MQITTALLVIDVQVGLIAGANPVYQADTILERIAGLIAAARAAGTPVIYAQDKDVGGVGAEDGFGEGKHWITVKPSGEVVFR